LGDRRGRGHSAAHTIPETSLPPRCAHCLGDRRKVCAARKHRLSLGDGDESSPQRNPPDETLGAVDRIQNPASPRTWAHVTELLAQNAVFRKPFLDPRPCTLLRTTIGDCYWRAVVLHVDSECSAVVGHREVSRNARELGNGVEIRLAHAAFLTGNRDPFIYVLSSDTVATPSCRIPATSAASAWPD